MAPSHWNVQAVSHGALLCACTVNHRAVPRWQSLHHLTPTPASEVASRLCLSALRQPTLQLIVPRCRLSFYGRRAFSIAGPTVWNSELVTRQTHIDPRGAYSFDSFGQFLKKIILAFTTVISALEVFGPGTRVLKRYSNCSCCVVVISSLKNPQGFLNTQRNFAYIRAEC